MHFNKPPSKEGNQNRGVTLFQSIVNRARPFTTMTKFSIDGFFWQRDFA